MKKCTVYFQGKIIAKLKGYKSLGDKEIEVLEGNVKIKHDNGHKIKVYYNKRLIGSLREVPLKFEDGYVDKFVLEYNNIEEESISVLLAIAVDIIN